MMTVASEDEGMEGKRAVDDCGGEQHETTGGVRRKNISNLKFEFLVLIVIMGRSIIAIVAAVRRRRRLSSSPRLSPLLGLAPPH